MWRISLRACATIAVVTCAASAQTASPPKMEFLRLARSSEGELESMDVAIVRYRPRKPANVSVDLVSAVHIGETEYYAELNRRFRSYDAVLFELIAPEGVKFERGGHDRGNPVSMLQGGMQTLLELEFQLEAIEYSRPNFVHADMTPSEFQQSMRDRNESMLQILARLWAKALVEQSTGESRAQEVELLAAMFSKNRAGRLKRVLAEQFMDMDDMMSIYTGSDGSTLVTERNKKALAVLRKQMKKGKRRIAIFYGAGHMSDFAERLENEFNMQKISVDWISAWDLRETNSKSKTRSKTTTRVD